MRTSGHQQLEPGPNYAIISLITLPLLAIFIGRPFFDVNVVSSEMPSALSVLAIKSSDVYGSLVTSVPSEFVSPITAPRLKPAPPTTTLQLRAQ
jgi:hypothetical protein